MSKTKATGSTRLGRDSRPKYLGVKLSGGQKAKPGNIIIRQRGSKFLPGINVKKGKDNTLYAIKSGTVRYRTVKKRKFDGNSRTAKIIDVV